MRGKGSERAKNERLRTELKQANRELRIFRAREQDASERGAGPADVEGVGGRPSILVYRDKNYLEFKRALDRAPAIPRLPLKRGDPDGERVGFRRGVYYLQNELGRLLDAIILSPAVTPAMVRDRHRMRMCPSHPSRGNVAPQRQSAGPSAPGFSTSSRGSPSRALFRPSSLSPPRPRPSRPKLRERDSPAVPDDGPTAHLYR